MHHLAPALRNALIALGNSVPDEATKSLAMYLDTLKKQWIGVLKQWCDDNKSYEKEILAKWNAKDAITALGDISAQVEKKIDSFIEKSKKAYWHDSSAVAELEQMFFKRSGGCVSKQFCSKIKKEDKFYRMRKAEKYEKFSHKGMYVIEASLSQIVGAMRYNVSGHASLYLADTLYTAWEELRRPELLTTNFVCYQANEDMIVLDLTIPDNLYSTDSLFRSYVALVCCAKSNDEHTHKWQYVLPTMMMQFLQHHQYKLKGKKGVTMLQGIRYISSRRYETEYFESDLTDQCVAYVFPQQQHNDGESHCPLLKQKFSMTEPFSFFYYQVHRYDFSSLKLGQKRPNKYADTLFAQIERQLQTEKFTPCSIAID